MVTFHTEVVLYCKQNGGIKIVASATASIAGVTEPNKFELQFYGINLI